METLIAPSINLGILIVVLAYYLRAPLRAFIAGRHSAVRDEVAKVREMLQQAQDKHNEFSSKLKAIDVEITSLREQAKQDAQATKLRVLSEAQRLSSTIVSDARATAEGAFADLKRQLHVEIGTRAIDRAEALLRDRLTGDDRARIRNEFSSQVEAVR